MRNTFSTWVIAFWFMNQKAMTSTKGVPHPVRKNVIYSSPLHLLQKMTRYFLSSLYWKWLRNGEGPVRYSFVRKWSMQFHFCGSMSGNVSCSLHDYCQFMVYMEGSITCNIVTFYRFMPSNELSCHSKMITINPFQ